MSGETFFDNSPHGDARFGQSQPGTDWHLALGSLTLTDTEYVEVFSSGEGKMKTIRGGGGLWRAFVWSGMRCMG